METLKFKSKEIIGRNKEITQLQNALNELQQGKGHTVFVSGEPGVGKTRLINETIKHIQKTGDVRTVKVYCLPHENTDSYLPFTEILKQIAPDQPLIPVHEEKKFVSIDEVFLVYKNNGVLIAHVSKKEQNLDTDIVAGMFTAVQDFVKDTFGKNMTHGAGLRRLEYGEKNILIEHGKNVYLAAVLMGPTATRNIYHDLRGAVEIIEKDYQDVLEGWDGNLDRVRDAATVLKMLTGKDYVVEETMDKSMLDTERLRVFEHVLNIVINTAKEKPLLLFFDDIQWADQSSMQLLHYLSRNTRDYPVLLCGAYRPEELTLTSQGKPHPLKETMQLMSREQLITNISLDRLKHDDTVDLVKSIFAHSFNPEFTKRLHQETEGNPFFTEEMLRAMVLDGIIYRHNAVWEAKDISKVVIPSSIKDTVMRRINSLDKDCQELLKHAAVIGQIFSFQTLSKTTGMDREYIAELLEKIEKTGIIHSEEDVLRFDHAKLQEVIYADIPKYRRNIIHEKTAQAIEKLNQEKPDTVSVELAYHYQQAGIPEKTIAYAIIAAENAEKKFTPLEAVQHYNTALQTLEKMKPTTGNKERMMKAADKIAYMYYISGDWDMSIKYNRMVGKLAGETKNQIMLAESYCDMGMIHINRADFEKASEELQNALRISEKINDTHGTAEAHYWIGKIGWRTGKLDEAIGHLRKCLSLAQETGDTTMISKAVMDTGAVHGLKGEYGERLEHMKRSLRISEKIDDKYAIARAYNNVGATYSLMGDEEKAIGWYNKCIGLCRITGYIRVVGYGLNNIAHSYAELNQPDRAKEHIDEALNIFIRLGEKRMIAACNMNQGVIYHKKKEWNQSIECFERAIKIFNEIEDMDGLSQEYVLYGKMLADKGDKTGAGEQYMKAVGVYEKLGNKAKAEEIRKEMEKLIV